MADWRKTDYGTPDTWAEQQQRKRNEEIARDGYNPFRDFAKIGVIAVFVVLCVIALLIGIFR